MKFTGNMAIALLLLSMLWYPALTERPAVTPPLLRLHIRANSDAVADQALKYRIRDSVLAVIEEDVPGAENSVEAEKKLSEALPGIKAAAEEEILAAGLAYPVRVELAETDFPTRLYGGEVYRAGRYRALTIHIGEALGENWWCVLFPPLCFLETAKDTAAPVAVQPESPPRPRSRLLEWWRKLSGRRA